MIISNGTLSYRVANGEKTYDEDGVPMPQSVEWSKPVPCLVQTSSDDRLGRYQDGVFRKVAMTLFTEFEVPLTADRVRVTRFEEDMGEHAVISIEPLPIVGAIKLYCS